ncbi:hypothetical protein [Natrinema salsiterrestre]|uniref:Uncharacterized protein n=1 Tax=Natrinema salsiterrestre TaxID=2950540 RepID=A0A9Q4KX93_9EURY|nr:hypothetical protein [Natrinema salsiterrestre]MDF9744925.1 hypothetical protein [Natrinema salsiterrestre]
MRSITTLGVALLVVGGLLFAASSGAFDSLDADREVGIETADDERALLSLDVPERIELSDGTLVCEGFFCYRGYRQYDVEIVTITDRTAPPPLVVGEGDVSLEAESGDNPSLEDWNVTTVDGGHVVAGQIRCDAPFGAQQPANTELTFDIETGDGEITISLDRRIAIQCA